MLKFIAEMREKEEEKRNTEYNKVSNSINNIEEKSFEHIIFDFENEINRAKHVEADIILQIEYAINLIELILNVNHGRISFEDFNELVKKGLYFDVTNENINMTNNIIKKLNEYYL